MKKAHIKKLDALWSKIIRSNGRCVACGKTDTLNAHHYIGRRNRNVRWYVPNGFCLCSGCHTFKTQSAHQDPEWFRERALDLRGQAWLDNLIEQSRVNCMAEKQVYEDIKEYLERLVSDGVV